MKKFSHLSLMTLLLALLVISPISCGGGGDGDDNGGGGGGGGGTTTQLTLIEENVDDTLSYIAEIVPGCSMPTAVAETRGVVGSVARVTKKVMDYAQFSNISKAVRTTAQIEPIDPIQGSCGGEIRIEIFENETTGEFEGDVYIDNFCMEIDDGEGGVIQTIINGPICFWGNDDPDTGELIELNAQTDGITVQEGADSYTIVLEGLKVTIDGDVANLTVDLLSVQGTVEGEAVGITLENFSLQVTEGGTTTQVETGGHLTVLGEGYVDFIVSLTISDEGDIISGQLEITGANGTKVVVTFVGNNSFSVEADTTGDGDLNYNPGTLDCSEFDLDID